MPDVILLVEPNGFYRQDVILAFQERGLGTLVMAGNIETVRQIIYNGYLPVKAKILIINGETDRAGDILLELIDGVETLEKIVEHSSVSHGLGDVFVPKTSDREESLKSLCEAIKVLTG